MNTYAIGQQLVVEETVLGATIHYRIVEGGRDVLFRVGMSHQSLQQCHAALQRQACLWTIKDGSLTVFGDPEELSLTFCSVQGRFIQAGLALHGADLIAFKDTIRALVDNKTVLLN